MTNMLQNRDGLPDALLDEKRFFPLYGQKKTDTPEGWNNPENWVYLDDIPEEEFFGFAIGKDSNYLFIDGDHIRDAESGEIIPWARDIFSRIFQYSTTYYEWSVSGTGIHAICDLGILADNYGRESNGYDQIIIDMDPSEYKKLSNEEREKTPKIEFFYHTAGRYAYLTGKHEKLVQIAKDEDAASIFSELLDVRKEFHAKHCSNGLSVDVASDAALFEIDEQTRHRVLEALPYISATSRETWVKVGIALRNCGFPFEVWDDWSKFADQRSGELCDKYHPEETPKIWKSFTNTKSRWNAGSIIQMAKDSGFLSKNHSSGSIRLSALSSIQEEEARWLIPGYIPEAQISLLVGDGGTGKTNLWCNLIGGITSGKRTILEADETERTDPVSDLCMFFSSEDSVPKILKRRLRAAGADESKILFLDLTDPGFQSIRFDSKDLESLVAEHRPALVVFDPLQSFIPSDIQMGSRNAMRQCLSPLISLGERFRTAFLIVLHTNKKQGVSGRTRCADSADIWDISRSVLIAGHTDEKGICYLSHEKSNYGELQETILFEIQNGATVYRGRTDKKDYDFVAERMQASRNSPAKDEAREYVLDLLAENKWHKVSEIDYAAKASGISSTTLRRAKKELKECQKVKYKCEGYGSDKVFFIKLT